jgi:hypothetical protein
MSHDITNSIERNTFTAARKGAQLLDRLIPEWHTRIDLDTLSMAHAHKCILGQLTGSFFTAETNLSHHYHSEDKMVKFTERNGFRITNGATLEWLILALAWEKEIEARNPTVERNA